MKAILGGILCGVILLAVIFGLNVFGLASYSFFAPRYTAADNKVFHESQQYNDGMVRDLENLKMQYDAADAPGKAALKPIIVHRFSIYPEEKMPDDLRNFYNKIVEGN